MSLKPMIVLLDPLEMWLTNMKYWIGRMPESRAIDVVGFTNDSDAAQFVAQNASQIVGYVQSLHRSDDLNVLDGIQFFNQVIDPFTPQAKTLIHSACITHNHIHDIYSNYSKRIDFLSKAVTSLEDFQERILWLLEPLSSKCDNNPKLISSDRQVVTLVASPWEEMCRFITNNPSFLHTMNPRKFEELIAEIFIDYGWQVDISAQTRDGGYDILAIRRSLPTDLKLLVEAKRYAPDHSVGVEVVRSLYGVRVLNSASQVVLATSSYVSRDAKREFERQVPWELSFLERDEILAWCHKHGGITISGSFTS